MARRRRVVWTRASNRQLQQTIDFIARNSPAAADRFLVRTLQLASSLSELASRGRVVPEADHPDLREVFLGHYRLMYLIGDDTVWIVAFVHGARDFASA